MGNPAVRYAEGELGKLIAFTGGDVPAGTIALTEEREATLTDAGKEYCKHHRLNPHPESIRVQYGQQSSYAVSEAIQASIKTQETRLDRDARAKAVSERLRQDWSVQDKAYQDALKLR